MIHFEPKATQLTENETYKVSDTFMINGQPYMLTALVIEYSKFALLANMITGHRWGGQKAVSIWETITHEEFTQLVGADNMHLVTRADFKLIQL